MKKIYQYLTIILAAIVSFTSCSEFDDINTNPDTTTKVTGALLATNLIKGIAHPGENYVNNIKDTYLQARYLGWSEQKISTQYNAVGRRGFGYHHLVDSEKMMEYTAGSNRGNAYRGLAAFVHAFKMYYITMDVGDIPYSEAGKAEHGIINAKYDTQKDVFLGILNDLDAAYNYFDIAEQGIEGDFMFKGDNNKWKRVVSAFQLKVLISLSAKENDTDLKVKARFADILANRDLLRSNADNFQLVYENKTGMINPLNDSQTSHHKFPVVGGLIIDHLKRFQDYRLFYFAEPVPAKITAGLAVSDWDAYVSVDTQLDYSDYSAQLAGGDCRLNERLKTIEGEPFWKVGYADMNFIIAEGLLRGWATGNSSQYYLEGIKAGLEFTHAATPRGGEYYHGREITSQYITDHLASPAVQLAGTFDQKLEMILSQRYINSFLQINERDVYHTNRRTGYPVFRIDPTTNENSIKEVLPVRYMYPSAEVDYNRENLQIALDRQYGGVDDVNKVMWLLQ